MSQVQVPPESPAPTPSARYTPFIWMASLIMLAMFAALLSLLAPRVVPAAPGPGGTSVYANNLASDDDSWDLNSDSTGQCVYANGGLDATSNDLTPQCMLRGHDLGDLRLSVRILPAASLNNVLQPAIFIHSDVAVLFSPSGEMVVLHRSNTLGSDNGFWVEDYALLTDEWHSADTLSNTVVIQVVGDIFTIGLNGAQIYQGDFGGRSANFTQQGFVALGTYPPTRISSGEATFADFALSTP
jgi:hypothetical protein